MSRPGPPLQCSIAIKDNPKERLLFESFPDSLDEGYSPVWRSRGGRATAVNTAYWLKGSFDSFNLQLTYVAGLFKLETVEENKNNNPGQTAVNLDAELQALEKKARWLQALCFPKPKRPRTQAERKSGIIKGQPPRILVTIGRFLHIEGVVDNYTVSWLPPFHPESARPYKCQVSLIIRRIVKFYPDYHDIVGAASRSTPPVIDGVKAFRNRLRNSWIGSFFK